MQVDLQSDDPKKPHLPARFALAIDGIVPTAPGRGGRKDDAERAAWRALRGSEGQALGFPTDLVPLPAATPRRAVVVTNIPRHVVERILDVGAANRATPFVTFLTALFALLQRSTEQTALLIGTPAAGREQRKAASSIDLPINMLPVRVETDGTQSFRDLLAIVSVATSDMHARARVPFEPLGAKMLDGSVGAGNSLFHVIFDYYDARPPAGTPELEVNRSDSERSAPSYDLGVVLCPAPDGAITCSFEYNAELYEPATIEVLAAHFRVLLESIADDETAGLDRLALATQTELATIVDVWSRPDSNPLMPPPGGDGHMIHELVAFNAQHRPDAIALIEDGSEPVTYAELDRRANRLAHALRARGVERDVCVGLYFARSVSAVIAMLATLKAGGAYVPLDPDYPPERIDYMIEKANVKTIVSSRQWFAMLKAYEALLVDIDDAAHGRNDGAHPPGGSDEPDSLAYVIFTSGSTGKPKAVGISHRAAAILITRTPQFACVPSDTGLVFGTLAFDASVLTIWSPLVYGARLVVMPAGPFALAEFEAQLLPHAVSVLILSPALFHQLVEERLNALRGLRVCTVGGDVLSPLHAARFAREFRICKLINGYGPTEATVVASLYEVRPDAQVRRAVPIGRPCSESRLYILDDRMQPVAVGISGELWIGGHGVARGYLNDESLTSERFVGDPFSSETGARMYRSGDRARWLPDGQIDFLGRADGQVKIRGFRIEPTAVEFALLEHPGVRHAAVVVRGSGLGKRLVAYADTRDPDLTDADLRAFLSAKIPPYAIPAQFVLLEELPTTLSGKIDRLNLPEPVAAVRATAAIPALDELQLALVSLWENLLGVHPIGTRDNFFALGGNSLLAVRLIGEIERQFHARIPAAVFFKEPTIENLANALHHDPQSVNASPLFELNPTGHLTPLFFLHGIVLAGGGYYCLEIAQELGADRPLIVMRPQGVEGDAMPATIEAVAAENIRVLHSAIPKGPYLLGGFCVAGQVAFEMARQLVAQGELVENVIVIDGPNAGPALRPVVEFVERFAGFMRLAPSRVVSLTGTLSRIAYHLADFPAIPNKLEYVRLTWAKIRKALNPSQLRAQAEGLERPKLDAVMQAWGWLSGAYVPRPYLGRLTLIFSAEEASRNIAVAGWLSVAPQADVRSIPGDHVACVSSDIATTAKAIAQAL